MHVGIDRNQVCRIDDFIDLEILSMINIEGGVMKQYISIISVILLVSLALACG